MSDEGYVFEWPLWGLRLDDTTTGTDHQLAIGHTLAYQPSWKQWEEMEHGDIVREYAGRELAAEQLGLPFNAKPPVCMLRLSEKDGSGDPDPTLDEQEDQMRALVAALRLRATGFFVDPNETGTYMTLPEGLTHRRVHVFRSAFYQEQPDDPYILGADDVDALVEIAHWLDVFRHESTHTSAAIALENFCLSFGTATMPGERALHHFVALEAMLGSVHGDVAGAPFTVRAANAMAEADNEVRGWLESAGGLRNRVAHEMESADVSERDLDLLGEVTRGVLFSYLVHVAQDGVPEAEAARPLRSFNRALASGPIEAEE